MKLIPNDTTIDAMRKQFEILERIGIEGRAEMTFELSDKAREGLIADIKKQYPAFTKQQVIVEVIRRCYGEELSQKVAVSKDRKE